MSNIAASTTGAQKRTQRLGTIFHTLTHLSIDFFLSFFAPTLPVLIASLGLLKVEAGILVLAVELSALTMPLIGRIADRHDIGKYMYLAPAITGLCMSSLTIMPNYGSLFVVLIIAGISIYYYHAIGPADVGKISEETLGQAMAIWNIAGQIAFMIGPMLISWILSNDSFIKAPYLSILGILASIVLYIIWKKYSASLPVVEHKEIAQEESSSKINPEILKQFVPILGIILTNALARAAAYAYFPVFLVEKGADLWISGLTVSLYFGAGVLGQYIGGLLYDKVGAKWVIAVSITGFGISFAAATVTPLVAQLVLISLTGFFAFMLVPSFMAMLQENFPEDRSLTNGLFLGLMYGLTALASVATGALLDRFPTEQIFLIGSGITLLGLFFTPFLCQCKREK